MRLSPDGKVFATYTAFQCPKCCVGGALTMRIVCCYFLDKTICTMKSIRPIVKTDVIVQADIEEYKLGVRNLYINQIIRQFCKGSTIPIEAKSPSEQARNVGVILLRTSSLFCARDWGRLFLFDDDSAKNSIDGSLNVKFHYHLDRQTFLRQLVIECVGKYIAFVCGANEIRFFSMTIINAPIEWRRSPN